MRSLQFATRTKLKTVRAPHFAFHPFREHMFGPAFLPRRARNGVAMKEKKRAKKRTKKKRGREGTKRKRFAYMREGMEIPRILKLVLFHFL